MRIFLRDCNANEENEDIFNLKEDETGGWDM
jgi:hypothetical protein